VDRPATRETRKKESGKVEDGREEGVQQKCSENTHKKSIKMLLEKAGGKHTGVSMKEKKQEKKKGERGREGRPLAGKITPLVILLHRVVQTFAWGQKTRVIEGNEDRLEEETP